MDLLDRVQAEQGRRSLRTFVEAAWPVLEPVTEFKPNWHIDAICEHLEAVSAGQIRKLLINIPPRCMKSRTCAVFWPAWDWINRPERRSLFSAYAETRSMNDSVSCRRLIESSWYQERWGDRFTLVSDQNTKTHFLNDKTGARFATGVGGVATGEGGDFVVVDDPHKTQTIMSDVERQNVLVWWDETMSTRLNDPTTGAHIIIMQRLHNADLSGHVLAQGGYEHLRLPMEYETDRPCVTVLGLQDKRTKDGELLWKTRFPKSAVTEIKTRLGSWAAAGQLQQRPAPRKGGIVEMGWFKRCLNLPSDDDCFTIIQSWDTGNKAKELNDPSVCGTWGETDEGWFLLHVWRRRVQFPELLRSARDLADSREPDAILIEDAASGTQLIQTLRRDETKRPILAIQPRGDKVVRMSNASPFIEAGNVWLPKTAEWLSNYEDEMLNFPHVAHDDQVDMTSQFLKWITKPKSRPGVRRL